VCWNWKLKLYNLKFVSIFFLLEDVHLQEKFLN
jgi:hypothetical protein